MLLYAWCTLVGICVGLEIPFVLRMLKRHLRARRLNELVSQVLTFDYLGALVVSWCSRCCWCRTWAWSARACSSGCSMRLVAIWTLWLFRGELRALARARRAVRR